MWAVARPGTIADLRSVLQEARKAGRPVSIAGGRHSMGGQPFGSHTVLVDTRGLDRVLDLDAERGLVTVEGGIQWPALLSALEVMQAGSSKPWGIVQKQTGADRLTLAGALSCNAHGRGLSLPPIVAQVESFDVMNADGELETCSRASNPELFSLAIGGYGLFGVITSIVLRLRRRCKVRRIVRMADSAQLMEQMAERVAEGFEYGDFQFAIDSADEGFLRHGVLSCYEPVSDDTPLTEDPVHFSAEEWQGLAVAAHVDKSAAFAQYAETYLRSSGQVYWSDAQLSGPYPEDYHQHVDRVLGRRIPGSEMITELSVPRERFEMFMVEAQQTLRERRADVIYGTVRLIEPDGETFLSWAREPLACTVLNLHIEHTDEAIAHAAETFRRLIDVAIGHGGLYYLPYHRWARRDQVERCYPQMRAFLKAKGRYDPEGRFQSDWYRSLGRLLGMSGDV